MKRVVLPLLSALVALSSLRAAEKAVQVEGKLITSQNPLVPEMAVPGMAEGTRVATMSGIFTPQTLEIFLKGLSLDEADVVSLPRVSTRFGQSATVEILKEIPAETALGDFLKYGQKAPVLSTSDETSVGYSMKFQAEADPDASTLHITADFQTARLTGFQETFLPDNRPLSVWIKDDAVPPQDFPRIRSPQIKKNSFSINTQLYDGNTLLLDLGKTSPQEGGRHEYLLLTARRVAEKSE